MMNLLKIALVILPFVFSLNVNAKTFKVKVSHGTFSPSNIAIKTGDKVTFTNTVDMKHSIVISGIGSSSKLKKGESWTKIFSKKGRFSCQIKQHHGKGATIKVK